MEKFNHLKFKELRSKKKLSIDDVGYKLGMSSATLYKYQSGVLNPSYEALEKIAELLSVDVKELIMEDIEASKNSLTPWKDEAYMQLKAENEKLWMLVQKLTGAAVGDLGKLLANENSAKGNIIPLFVSPVKRVA